MGFLAALPAIMSGVGALSGMFGGKSSTWSGKQPSYKKMDVLNSEQKHLLKQITKHPGFNLPNVLKDPNYQQGGNFLQSILSQNPEMMKQFEAPYMRQFNEEIVPEIAERFGGAGALGSSAFQNAMGQAGSGLMERLAALRGGMGMQAAQQALGYSQLPFNQAFHGAGLQAQRESTALGTQPFGYQGMAGTQGIGQPFANLMSSIGGNSGIMQLLSSLFGGE